MELKTAVSLFCATAFLAYALPSSGSEGKFKAFCGEVGYGKDCHLGWEFPESAKSRFVVQEWDNKAAEWISLKDSESSNPFGSYETGAKQGKLYRVIGCNSIGCDSSNVVWSPDWTDPSGMPDTVPLSVDGKSIVLAVDKMKITGERRKLRRVVAQYNMYRVLAETTSFFDSDAEMPSMNEAVMEEGAPRTLEEMVQFNVRSNYESTRHRVLGLRRLPAGFVPAEEQLF